MTRSQFVGLSIAAVVTGFGIGCLLADDITAAAIALHGAFVCVARVLV